MLVLKAYYSRDSYTVTFYNWDGEKLDEQTVPYESDATAPETPTRKETDEYTYTFKEWDKDFTNVSENLDVTAVFTETPKLRKKYESANKSIFL